MDLHPFFIVPYFMHKSSVLYTSLSILTELITSTLPLPVLQKLKTYISAHVLHHHLRLRTVSLHYFLTSFTSKLFLHLKCMQKFKQDWKKTYGFNKNFQGCFGLLSNEHCTQNYDLGKTYYTSYTPCLSHNHNYLQKYSTTKRLVILIKI